MRAFLLELLVVCVMLASLVHAFAAIVLAVVAVLTMWRHSRAKEERRIEPGSSALPGPTAGRERDLPDR
jgi:putative exporter of polyketide antibiotics